MKTRSVGIPHCNVALLFCKTHLRHFFCEESREVVFQKTNLMEQCLTTVPLTKDDLH